MGRRKKGKHINGWCIIDKPAGLTSTQVVNKTRWAFDAQKAGHAGTLDPDATGLLAVALGEATKIIPFVTDALKAYHFTVSFGQATTTDDASGEVLIHGKAFISETSVDDLRHYAEDAGASDDEIAAITTPKTSYNFEADGVLISQ